MDDVFTREDNSAIRIALESDVPFIVNIHKASFLGFFLTFLGTVFLQEFYVATLTNPDGIGFVYVSGAIIRGFIIGSSHPSGLYRRLLRERWWRFALASVAPVIKRPSIIPRLLRAFSMPGQATHQHGRGTLMSIAVLPQAQGQGIGKALLNTFLKEAALRNLSQVDLTTDSDNNEATNRFYQNLGFVCERTFKTPEGRNMNQYVIDLAALS